jgi:hypothetical protein
VNRDYKTLSTFSDSARGRMLRRRLEAEASFMRRLHEKFSAAHRDTSSEAGRSE